MPTTLQDASWLVRSLRPEMSHPVGDEALAALAANLERKRLPAGQLLYRRGARPAGVWAIRSGTAELSIRGARTRSVVQLLRPGDVAGDVSVLLGSPALTTARVKGPGTFLFLRRDVARSIVSTHADLCFLWMQNVAFRLEGARRRILEVLGEDLSQAVSRLLLDEEVGGSVRLAQSAIADMLGVQRSSVNRVLRSLHRRGIVTPSYGTVTINDRDALEDIAVVTGGGFDAP
ncbi:MAG TPA: Crp/Fnr family transcriptional regulator [Actinomycetota bacterium]|nr:Crp/Fnr family transcriptional regulator [Actinomycetota bacterium]